MTEADFIPKPYATFADAGSFAWSAPSNIALVKYWGKRGNQLPANPSLSFTLDACKTVTKVAFERRDEAAFTFDLLFDGQSKETFRPKIDTFLKRARPFVPFIDMYHFTIDTRNTFPHSSGIASSASGMAALAVNLMSIERLLDPEMTDDMFFKKASFLARLGSGSACRSVKGSAVVWGEHGEIEASSDLYGVELPVKMHPAFEDFRDTILLVDEGEKQVSSTVGHGLMENHPYAAQRFAQAHLNLSDLKRVLAGGDLDRFVAIVESEALTLHAMMMTSMPNFMLMKPGTLLIIELVREFRKETGIPVCFTLDAGANVHLLYPDADATRVSEFIKSELSPVCNGNYIDDKIGKGAQII